MAFEQALVWMGKDPYGHERNVVLMASTGGALEAYAYDEEYEAVNVFADCPEQDGFWIWEGEYSKLHDGSDGWRRPAHDELAILCVGDNPFAPVVKESKPPPLPSPDYKAKAEYFEKEYTKLLTTLRDIATNGVPSDQ